MLGREVEECQQCFAILREAFIGKLQFLHCGQKRPGLHLDSLRKKLPRTRSKNISQRIVDLVGLTKTENIDSLVHGVSLSLRVSGRLDTRLNTPPISIRHHPVSSLAHRNKAET